MVGAAGRVIAEGSRVVGGGSPGAGGFSCWWRRVVMGGGERFLVTEPFMGNRADNYPWVDNSPPFVRKDSATRK